jgi:hypothetical protein
LRVHRLAAADIFQTLFARPAIRSLAQIFELFGFQFAHVARFNVEYQRAVSHTADLFDVMPDLLKHLAQLAVAAFDDDDFVPGVIALADLANLGGRGLHSARSRLAPLDSHA